MTSKPLEDSLDRYRTESLKLRRVLYDRPTGLPAFPVLFDRLHTLLGDRRHLGVIHVEIANLDMVESLYGWQVFDRIIGRVSDLLRKAVGRVLPADTLLAINGVAGDRFVAFIPDAGEDREIDLETLSRIGGEIGTALETEFDSEDFAGLSPRLRFRTGHSLLSEDPFYRFERRVYGAVEEARNLGAQREERWELSWGAELKRIIKHSEVSTVFQPVVDLESGALFGFEALARGPKDSFFEMPRAMFALSNRVGVSVDLDRLCRDTALKELARLSSRGKVFVNVLPRSLADPTWVAGGVGTLLDAVSLRPVDLVIEISERVADEWLDRCADPLQKLREHGFGLALDDVGTGYATITNLEKIRPDFLKVDASVVRDIHRSLIKQEVVSSIVQVARQVGASVIAKGVESGEEAKALRAAGARYGQGYFYAKPASPGSARLTDRFRSSGH